MELENCKINKVIVNLEKEGKKNNKENLLKTASVLESEFKEIEKFDKKKFMKKLDYIFETYKDVLLPKTNDIKVSFVDKDIIDITIGLTEKESTKTLGFDGSYGKKPTFNVLFKNHNFMNRLFNLNSQVGIIGSAFNGEIELVRDMVLFNKGNIINLKIRYHNSIIPSIGVKTKISEKLNLINDVKIKKNGVTSSHLIKFSKIDDIYFPSKGYFGSLKLLSSNDIYSDLNLWLPLGNQFTLGSKLNLHLDKLKVDTFTPEIFIERKVSQVVTLGTSLSTNSIDMLASMQTPFGIFTVPLFGFNKDEKEKYKLSKVKDFAFNTDTEIVTMSKKVRTISKKVKSILNSKQIKLKDLNLKKLFKKKSNIVTNFNKIKMRSPFLL